MKRDEPNIKFETGDFTKSYIIIKKLHKESANNVITKILWMCESNLCMKCSKNHEGCYRNLTQCYRQLICKRLVEHLGIWETDVG